MFGRFTARQKWKMAILGDFWDFFTRSKACKILKTENFKNSSSTFFLNILRMLQTKFQTKIMKIGARIKKLLKIGLKKTVFCFIRKFPYISANVARESGCYFAKNAYFPLPPLAMLGLPYVNMLVFFSKCSVFL
jgi:hypothetical protein